MGVRFALAGNQNCGKTTLFNTLTGSRAKVGNFPGVTVEKREGALIKESSSTVIDLPGVYSLLPYTTEERVTRDYLMAGETDCIINVIDSTNLERSLYLTYELMSLGKPMIVALNMVDELTAGGGGVDAAKLSIRLGVPAVPVSALTGDGVDELIKKGTELAVAGIRPAAPAFSDSALNKVMEAVQGLFSFPFSANELLDAVVTDGYSRLPPAVKGLVEGFEKLSGQSIADSIVGDRYKSIEACCQGVYQQARIARLKTLSRAIDKAALNKYLGFPIFFGLMILVFWLSFSAVGEALSGLCNMGLKVVMSRLSDLLNYLEASNELRSFVNGGIMAGISSVISFLPTIIIMFLLLSILEDSGYMARVAYIMDRPFRAIGLSGRYMVPMLLGLGCSVPAIMAARAVGKTDDRRTALLLVPFMSCSAKLPVYVAFSGAFFGKKAFLAVSFLYFLGIGVAVLYALIIKALHLGAQPTAFVMELPDYRFPSVQNVLTGISEKIKEFTKRVFSVILISNIVIWGLSRYGTDFSRAIDQSGSLLAAIGRAFVPIFRPLGFGEWRLATAVVSGFVAKEAVLSTICVLAGCRLEQLQQVLPSLIEPAAALSFLCFVALYSPCITSVFIMSREMGGIKRTAAALLVQTAVAYLISFGIYRLSLMLF